MLKGILPISKYQRQETNNCIHSNQQLLQLSLFKDWAFSEQRISIYCIAK